MAVADVSWFVIWFTRLRAICCNTSTLFLGGPGEPAAPAAPGREDDDDEDSRGSLDPDVFEEACLEEDADFWSDESPDPPLEVAPAPEPRDDMTNGIPGVPPGLMPGFILGEDDAMVYYTVLKETANLAEERKEETASRCMFGVFELALADVAEKWPDEGRAQNKRAPKREREPGRGAWELSGRLLSGLRHHARDEVVKGR